MQPDMNSMMRQAGNRSRSLPNIGQTPAVQAANLVMGQQTPPQGQPASSPGPMPASPPAMGSTPPISGSAPSPSPMAAPPIQQQTFTMHPPGSAADPNSYNYEPQPDGSWRVYPPGVSAPNHTVQASMPRAASTADYRRMSAAMRQMAAPQAPPQAAAPSMAQPPAPNPMV